MELQEFILPMNGPHCRSAIVCISDVCGVTKITVTRWIEQGAPLKDFYQHAINDEFRKKLFEL